MKRNKNIKRKTKIEKNRIKRKKNNFFLYFKYRDGIDKR